MEISIGMSLSRGIGQNVALPFTADFSTFPDGAMGWPWTNSAWAVSGGAVATTLTLGAELLSNPGFEGVYVAGLAPNWFKSLTPIVAEENGDVHGGSAAQSVTADAQSEAVFQSIGTAIGPWYLFSLWGKRTAGAANNMSINMSNGVFSTPSVPFVVNDWRQRFVTTFGAGATLVARAATAGVGPVWDTVLVDDGSVKALTLTEQISAFRAPSNLLRVRARWNLVDSTWGGVISNLDNPANPQSFVLALHDGQNFAWLMKYVSGTPTRVLAVNVAYVAGAGVEVRQTAATTFQLWYNDVQVGADQTINDPEIINNKYCGVFNSYGGNSLMHFFASA